LTTHPFLPLYNRSRLPRRQVCGTISYGISIVRTILKDALVILLDEASAALNPENELFIQRAINDLVQDKTVIVIVIAPTASTPSAKPTKSPSSTKAMSLRRARTSNYLQTLGCIPLLWEEQRRVKSWKF
jgi:ATP-binding cassette subfamily B protein